MKVYYNVERERENGRVKIYAGGYIYPKILINRSADNSESVPVTNIYVRQV